MEIEANQGDFDLRGYEIARAQFFDTSRRISMTFSNECLNFSTECIRKFDRCTTIELLVNPEKCQFVIRPATKDNRTKIQWSRFHDGAYVPRQISGAAFLPTIYQLFGWKESCKYRLIGLHKQKGNSGILIFDTHEVEVMIPAETIEASVSVGTPVAASANKKSILAYPANWAEDFGENYYTHSKAKNLSDDNWNVHQEGRPYKESDIAPTPLEEVKKGINEILEEITQEAHDE